MDWSIEIERADNGYTANWWDDNDEGEELIKHQAVFEEEETETGELDCMVKLLNFVSEHFGFHGSKHDKYRLKIEVMKNEDD